MDLRGQVWQITRLENRCAYVRTPDLILDDHREERAFTQQQVRQWPVVQIQHLPSDPPDPPLFPCPFCGAQPRLFNYGSRASIGCTCGVGINVVKDRDLAITKWNARVESKLDHAPRPKARPDVRWTYNRNTQILIGEIEDDESIESFRCFLRLAAADDRSTKAIDLVLHQLNAKVTP